MDGVFLSDPEKNESIRAAVSEAVQRIDECLSNFPSVSSSPMGAVGLLASVLELDFNLTTHYQKSILSPFHLASAAKSVPVLVPEQNDCKFERKFFRRVKKRGILAYALKNIPVSLAREIAGSSKAHKLFSQIAQFGDDQQILRILPRNVNKLNEMIFDDRHSAAAMPVAAARHSIDGAALSCRFSFAMISHGIQTGKYPNDVLSRFPDTFEPLPMTGLMSSDSHVVFRMINEKLYRLTIEFRREKSFGSESRIARMKEAVILRIESLIRANFNFKNPHGKTPNSPNYSDDVEFERDINRWKYLTVYPSQSMDVRRGQYIATCALLPEDLVHTRSGIAA